MNSKTGTAGYRLLTGIHKVKEMDKQDINPSQATKKTFSPVVLMDIPVHLFILEPQSCMAGNMEKRYKKY